MMKGEVANEIYLKERHALREELLFRQDVIVKGEGVDPSRYSIPILPTQKPLSQVINDVAIISLHGAGHYHPTLNDFNFPCFLFEVVIAALVNADRDPNINTIIIVVEGTGGGCEGSFDLAWVIHRLKTPCYAICTGSALSAHLLFLCAPKGGGWISGQFVRYGSIGVSAKYIVKEDAPQIKTIEFIEGDFKGAGNPYCPTAPGLVEHQEDNMKFLYRTFIETIAEFRGLSSEDIQSMAEGKIFYGRQGMPNLINGYFDVERWFTDHEFIPILPKYDLQEK
jgi:ClpP class serine protease